ncbi:hypothetical protein N9281_01040 [bacterium]|nr:hypothetical protein [bacterium]
MTSYTNIQANTQASEPLTTTVVTALDRNLYALFEGDSTATPFAQLQEPAIQDLAVTEAKMADVIAPTSTSTGVFTNAIAVSTIQSNVVNRTSTTAVYQSVNQILPRAGSYTFYLYSRMTRSNGNMITKNSLVVNGVVEASTTYSSGSNYSDQVTLTGLSSGDIWYIKNERISGTGEIDSTTSAVALIADTSSIDELYLDRGIYQRFGAYTDNWIAAVIPIWDWSNLSNLGAPQAWFSFGSLQGLTQPAADNKIYTI